MSGTIAAGAVIQGVLGGISAVVRGAIGSVTKGDDKAEAGKQKGATNQVAKKNKSATEEQDTTNKQIKSGLDGNKVPGFKDAKNQLDMTNPANLYGFTSPSANHNSTNAALQAQASQGASPIATGIPGGIGPNASWAGTGAQIGSNHGSSGSGPIVNPPNTPPAHNHTSLASITQERNEYVKAWGGHISSTPSDTWPKTISITGLDAKAVAGFKEIQNEYAEYRAAHNLPPMNVTQKIEYSNDGKANISIVLNNKQVEQQTSSSMTQMVAENNSREQQQRVQEATHQSIDREANSQQTA